MAENSLSDLITYIGTDVYGREMREHIKEAFQILANSSLTAEERAKIAASISYEPQTLNETQKSVARNNIGAAKAGETGRGWTEEQINLLESFKEFFDIMKDHIGYNENSADGAGQTAAKDAVDALASLITSLRTVPRELESITVALKEDVTPMNGRSIQLNELEVTGHYSDGTSSTIESGYELSALSDTVWRYPKTTVLVKYLWKGTLYTSLPVEISLSSDAYAWITIDQSSDKEHLNYVASIGGAERQFDSYDRIKVLPTDKNSGITVLITVKSDYSADKELDPSSTVTMNGDPMSGAGAGIWGASQITGDVVIKGVSKNKVATTYTATFIVDGDPYDTVTFEAGATVLPRVPSVPTKSHYTGAWEPYTLADADITINAVYTPVQYTITFRDDGGDHPQYYTEPTAGSVTAPTPTPRTNYTVAWPSWSVAYDNSQVVEAVYTALPTGGKVEFDASLAASGSGICISFDETGKMSTHGIDEANNQKWTIANWSGTRGTGLPTSIEMLDSSVTSGGAVKSVSVAKSGATYAGTYKNGPGGQNNLATLTPTEGNTNFPTGAIYIKPGINFVSTGAYHVVIEW